MENKKSVNSEISFPINLLLPNILNGLIDSIFKSPSKSEFLINESILFM